MLQFAGFWMALATFIGIWWGHVGVRWLEAHVPNIWPAVGVLLTAGIGLNAYSLFAPNLTLAGVSSIIGITLMWDALEMYRQQQRIRKGHAPANPNNPRHAAYLAAGGKATVHDPLDREPQGLPVGQTMPASQYRPTVEYRTWPTDMEVDRL
jgi:hypothetical protein